VEEGVVMTTLVGKLVVISVISFLLSPKAFAFLGISCNPEDKDQYQGVNCAICHGPGATWDTLCGAFDPEQSLRIVYETPKGCDEVSGTTTLKASVQGPGAPTPVAMRYELRTEKEGVPIVLTGNAPTYEVSFDTTQVRDGFIWYKTIPLDEMGDPIDIKAPPYNAPGIIPAYVGIVVNNNLDLSKPLVIIGSPIQPYPGPFVGWTPEELKSALTYGLNLANHLAEAGYYPGVCLGDNTTMVLDPSDPLADPVSDFVDTMGEPVAGTPQYNPGTPCLSQPFFEVPVPNGLVDYHEYTAVNNVKQRVELQYEHLPSAPETI
jgi:hypothetical protein